MTPSETTKAGPVEAIREKNRSMFADFVELTKPEIAFLVAISALAGFVLGSDSGMSLVALLHTLFGTAVAASAGGMLNHYVERHHDAGMHRTSQRPVAAGRISPAVALLTALSLGVLGVVYLWYFLNLLTAALALLTIVLYIVIYTPLKRITKYNTLVGTIPGALPALGGWTAATGSIGIGGLIVFGILVAWQMPHFLALAWMYRKDYERGGFKMVTVTEPEGKSAARQTVGFTILLVLLSVLPGVFGLAGWVYTLGVSFPGLYFLLTAASFYEDRSHKNAKMVLTASIYYIPVLVLLIFLDHWTGG